MNDVSSVNFVWHSYSSLETRIVNDLLCHQKKCSDAQPYPNFLSFFCLPFLSPSYPSPFLYLLILFPSPLLSYVSLPHYHSQHVSYFLSHAFPSCCLLFLHFHHGCCSLGSDHVNHHDVPVVWTWHYDFLLVKNRKFCYDVDLTFP